MGHTPGTTIQAAPGSSRELQDLANKIQGAFDERDVAPVACLSIATPAAAPSGTKYPSGSMIYVRSTNQPAWNDANGTWRYADASAI